MSDFSFDLASLVNMGQLPPGVLAQIQQQGLAKGVPGATPVAAPVAPGPMAPAVVSPPTPAPAINGPGSPNQVAVGGPMVMNQPSAPLQAAPMMANGMTGLMASERALQGGAEAAMSGLMTGFNEAKDALGRPVDISAATALIEPYMQPGQQAFNAQAALSGAMGSDAQREAYANFNESPGQQYLRSRAEQALLRNSAALGGLGGGRVRQELQRQAIGEASQDFNNNFARLGQVAQGGLQAANLGTQLYGQKFGNETQRALGLGQIAQSAGNTAADIAFRTAQSVSQGRTNAGNNIANALGGTLTALANLSNQQGQGISDTIGSTAGDLANIISGAGQGQAASQQNLATILANIAAGQGSQTASLPGIPGAQQTNGILGNVGNFLSGVGSLLPQNR